MNRFDPDFLRERYSDLELDVEASLGGELRMSISGDRALDLLRRLAEDEASPLTRLVDLTAIDHGEGRARFEVVYRLDSVDRRTPVRVHARIASPEADSPSSDDLALRPTIDSVVKIWPSASWLEREVYDLFGIRFRGHSELRRLLLDESFEGAPLRKDFPRAGHVRRSEVGGDEGVQVLASEESR